MYKRARPALHAAFVRFECFDVRCARRGADVHRRDVWKYGVHHHNFHASEIVRWIWDRHLQCNTILTRRP